MKLTASLILILSTTSIGILLSEKAKQRVEICTELIQLCDVLRLDIGFRNTPLDRLISSLSFKWLDFLTVENIASERVVNSPLRNEENAEISRFLYSLGKSDSTRQLKLIEGFRDYMNSVKSSYKNEYIKNSKIYIGFGFFSGAVVSLVML